jgi:hypothetical protein
MQAVFPTISVNEVRLTQGQRFRRLCRTNLTIGLDSLEAWSALRTKYGDEHCHVCMRIRIEWSRTYVSFRINLHLWPPVVELHVTLPHSPAVFHRLHSLFETVLLHHAISACLAHPCNRQCG